jgi:putative dimethyl sulfoxide reductase chaperone
VEDLIVRRNMYQILGVLFEGVPGQQLVAALRTEPILAELGRLVADEPARRGVLERLRTLPLSALTDEVAVDYTMLFSAPGPTQVPPYESVYRDKLEVETLPQPEIDYAGGVRTFEGLYWGDSTVAVAGEYGAEGFDVGGQIPDSLALELAFMAHLCEQELSFREAGNVEAAEAYAFRRSRFLSEHLMQWVPTFVGWVAEKRPGGFYALAAQLTLRYLEAEREAIDDVRANRVR